MTRSINSVIISTILILFGLLLPCNRAAPEVFQNKAIKDKESEESSAAALPRNLLTGNGNLRIADKSGLHRQLFELKFLTDMMPQIPDSPLQFLSKEVTDQHKPPAVVTPAKEITTPTNKGKSSKPIEFLTPDKTLHGTQSSSQHGSSSSGTNGGFIHFLKDGETPGESSSPFHPSGGGSQTTSGSSGGGTVATSPATGAGVSAGVGTGGGAGGDELKLHELEVVSEHPFVSPRRGSDISAQHQMGLLLCPNQSKCVVPELQLEKKNEGLFLQTSYQ